MTSSILPLVLCLSLLAAAPGAQQPAATGPSAELLVYDWHLQLDPADAVEHLRDLGFAGVVTRVRWPDDVTKLARYVRAASAHDDFRAMAYVAYDFHLPAAPNVWRAALPILADAGAPLWVVVKNAPSEAAVVVLLRQMAREALEHGVPAVVYPHWNTAIETADEAAALIEAVGHPNLGNSLHTCHEIRGGHQDDLPAVVDAHVDQTSLVAIAGADTDAYAGPPNLFVTWDDAIKPLDAGDFSLAPFLEALHAHGYDGPVILQTYGITNDPGHLRRSLGAYADYVRALNPRRAP